MVELGGVMRFFLTITAFMLVPGIVRTRSSARPVAIRRAGTGQEFHPLPYVNPKAPKGGELRVAAIGSFDNLNNFTIKEARRRGFHDLRHADGYKPG